MVDQHTGLPNLASGRIHEWAIEQDILGSSGSFLKGLDFETHREHVLHSNRKNK